MAGFVFKRSYTIVAAMILVCLLALGAIQRMPMDIFPEIDIPVVTTFATLIFVPAMYRLRRGRSARGAVADNHAPAPAGGRPAFYPAGPAPAAKE